SVKVRLSPAHHHIGLPATAAGADQPLAPSRSPGAVASSHLGKIDRRDLVAATTRSTGPLQRPPGLFDIVLKQNSSHLVRDRICDVNNILGSFSKLTVSVA